jgi:hypothetical protein
MPILACPIDGLAVALISPALRGDVARDQTTHLHLMWDETFTCLNGHQWRLRAEMILERVG